MLNFTTSLVNALSKTATQSYWLLRLYYNNESAYTGISDRTRTIGGVVYYGLASWGSGHNQTLNIDQFTTSNGTMEVGLNNAPNKIEGKRFSDLFADNNYSNRKWELFQCDENADFSTDNLIAGGIISSDIKPTPTQITMYLNDYWAKYDIELPVNKVTKATYPNAPENNLDKPTPMAYGDCSYNTAEDGFISHLVKGRFPAIVTDKWSDDASNTQAKPDSEAMHTLSTSNLYMHNKKYTACEPTNVTVTAATPIITFKGNKWTDFTSLLKWNTYEDTNYGNTIDQDPTTSYNLDATGAVAVITGWRVLQPFNKPGLIETAAPDSHTIRIWVLTGTKTGTQPVKPGPGIGWYLTRNEFTDYDLDWTKDTQGIDITGLFGAVQIENWDFQGVGNNDRWQMVIDDAFNTNWDQICPIIDIGYIIELTTEKSFEKEIQVEDSPLFVGNLAGRYGVVERYKTVTVYGTDVGDYVYWSGKGRKYGTWINARGLPYSNGNLIENPVFIIENIFRTEVGLNSEINIGSFNSAGDESGDLENGFGVGANNVEDIKFAFSNYRFIKTKRLVENIGQQSGCYVWWSGDTVAIKARRRTYTSANSIIDFKDIKIVDFGLTPMDDVFNDIQVDYSYDYAKNKTNKSRTSTDNGSLKDDGANSSQSDDVEGYDQILKLVHKMSYTLDSDTADNYGEALLAWFKDRKQIITIDTKDGTAEYNALEVGDIINFSNWDSNLKIFGDTISTSDGFMITQITKRPNGARIVVTEVTGTIS